MATAAVTKEAIASLRFLHRVAPGLPVWQLRTNALGIRRRNSDETKFGVLERLCTLSTTPVFLVYSEDPIGDEVPGQWEHITDETWRIPADADVGAMAHWLYLGGWILYAAQEPIEANELLSMGFAPKAETIAEVSTRLRLGFIVVSFHDDVMWTIALGNDGKSEQLGHDA